MKENNVVSLRRKAEIDDPLTEILRSGARRLIAQAVEAEFETFLVSTADLVLADGRRRVVRHGHDPARAIQTGIGPVEVRKPKARDRDASSGARIRFTSNILPKWARRTKSLDALLPVLYLRGISAGDFQEVLAALLGKDAPNLSPSVIARPATRLNSTTFTRANVSCFMSRAKGRATDCSSRGSPPALNFSRTFCVDFPA
jgi:putative transposase